MQRGGSSAEERDGIELYGTCRCMRKVFLQEKVVLAKRRVFLSHAAIAFVVSFESLKRCKILIG